MAGDEVFFLTGQRFDKQNSTGHDGAAGPRTGGTDGTGGTGRTGRTGGTEWSRGAGSQRGFGALRWGWFGGGAWWF